MANGVAPVLPWNCDGTIPLLPLPLISTALTLGQGWHTVSAQEVLPAAIMQISLAGLDSCHGCPVSGFGNS